MRWLAEAGPGGTSKLLVVVVGLGTAPRRLHPHPILLHCIHPCRSFGSFIASSPTVRPHL